ncbi:MAG: hypothetical protein KBF88_14330, partial [Polyangiaceae bacterium]|nr:hypothetical protein [Polyangiaceae bacterium]
SVKFPDGVVRSLPVREGRAILQGDRVGFYEVLSEAGPKTDPAQGGPDQPPKTPAGSKPSERGERISGFAANLANRDEITIAPEATLVAGGKTAERVQLSSVQTNQPLWAILVLIVAAIALLEWATYHKRVTV